MSENTIKIYEGELILACHQITQRVAEKAGLNYSNAEGRSLNHLEHMAEHLLLTLQHNNPDKQIVVIRKPLLHNLVPVPEMEGLHQCIVCGAAEGELPTHCPDRVMSESEREGVMNRMTDFKDGQWIGVDKY